MQPKKLFNRNYICILINVVVMNLGFNMLSTVITPYVVSCGYSLALAGFVAGIMSIAAMCFRPVTGIISDLFAPRKLLMISATVTTLIIMGYGFIQNAYIMTFLRVIHGISFGITTTATMAITGRSIPVSRLGEGMGYYGAAQAVASAIGPNLGLTLSEALGYHMVFLLAAGFTCLATISAVAISLEPLQRNKRNTGIKKRILAPEALRYLPVCFVLGSIGGLEANFLALYGNELGLSGIGWYFTVSATTLIISKFLLGKVGDKLPFRTILFLGTGLIGSAFLLLSFLNAEFGVSMLATAAILRSMGVGILQPAVQAECFKSVSDERRGAASATYMLEMDLGVGSAPILGAALQKWVGFSGVFFCYLIPLIVAVWFYFRSAKKTRSNLI